MVARVWVRHATHGWAEAEVVHQLDGGRVRLRMPDGANFTAAAGDVCPKNAAGMDAPDALESLEHIDDPNVLHALRARFKAGKTYTWADHVLVSTGAAQPASAGTEFPPGASCSLTQKLLTRMATRDEPQLVLLTGGAGAVGGGFQGGGNGNRAAAQALSQSLAAVARPAARPAGDPLDLSNRISVARDLTDAFLGVMGESSGEPALAACRRTTFEFVEIESAWTPASVSISASFVDWARCVSIPGAANLYNGEGCHRSYPSGSFHILAQLVAAAQTGTNPELTADLSSHASERAVVDAARCLRGWELTLRSMRELQFQELEVGAVMKLASAVLNLLALGIPEAGAEESKLDKTTSSTLHKTTGPDAPERDPDADTISCSAVVSAIGVEDGGVQPRASRVVDAVCNLLASRESSGADAAISAGININSCHVCVMFSCLHRVCCLVRATRNAIVGYQAPREQIDVPRLYNCRAQ